MHLVCCILLVLSSTIHLLAQPPFVKVPAVADTYIDAEFPTTNFGSAFQLRVVDLAFPKESNTLLRFDISAWNQHYSNLVGAKLLLCIENDGGFDSEVGRMQGLGTTWAESYPTWDNAHNAVNWEIAGSTYNNTSTGKKWQVFDVTDDVYQMLSGGYQNEGFSIKWPNASIDYVMTYYSKENADPPNVSLSVDPVLFLAFDQTSWNNASAIAANGIFAPSAPTADAATSVTSSGFTANWSSSTGAAGYRLDVSTSNTFSSFVPGHQDLNVGNVTSQGVSGLTYGQTYYYRIRAYNSGGAVSGNSNTIGQTVTSVELANSEIPVLYSLSQNYPNPFNPATTIQFSIPKKDFIVLTVFNALGMQIEVLVNQHLPPGNYQVNWIPRAIPSGVYFYQLRVAEFVDTKRLLLIK